MNESAQVKKKKFPKLLLIPLVILLIAGMVVGWYGLNHSNASSSYEKGEYKQAIEYAEKDPIFSKELLQKAYYAHALDLVSQNKFGGAKQHLNFLTDASARREGWLQMCDAMVEAGKFQDAQELIGEYAGDPDFLPILDRSWVVAANYYLEKQDYVGAKAALNSVSGQPEGLAETQSKYHFMLGYDAFNSGDYTVALQEFHLSDDPRAAQFCTVLEPLKADDYLGAISAAFEDAARPDALMYMDRWERLIRSQMHDPSMDNVDERLLHGKVDAIFSIGRSLNLDANKLNALEDTDRNCDKVALPGNNDRFCNISADDLKRCTGTGTGKILFVREQETYPKDGYHYAVPMYLMELLPEEKYPSCLEEVEFIIFINTKNKVVSKGYYSGHVNFTFIARTLAVLQLTSQIYVEDASGQEIYRSKAVSGDRKERTNIFKKDWYFLTCSEPQMGSYLLEAINTVK